MKIKSNVQFKISILNRTLLFKHLQYYYSFILLLFLNTHCRSEHCINFKTFSHEKLLFELRLLFSLKKSGQNRDSNEKSGHFNVLTTPSRKPGQRVENRECPGKTGTSGQPSLSPAAHTLSC